MATADTIELVNVGAIKEAVLPFIPGGGVVVIEGPQGCGKSTALDALQAVATGKGKVPLRDKASKGYVKAFGGEMKLGGKTTRSGAPQVVSIEGKLSVGDIVEPGIADPAAADAKRIKALVQLAGDEADPSLFAALFGGYKVLMDAVVRSLDDGLDLVAMADRVKRECERVAREEEKAAENAAGRASALKQAAGNFDTTLPHDAAELHRELEEAIKEEARIRASYEAQVVARQRVANSKSELFKLNANRTLPTKEVADARLKEAEDACCEVSAEVDSLEQQLARAKSDLSNANQVRLGAVDTCKQVADFDGLIERYRSVVESGDVGDDIDAGDVEEAATRVAEARGAMEVGVAARAAIENLANAKEAEQDAATHAKAAKTLRSVAKKTDGVLSAQVAKLGTPLRVEDGRLLVDTERGPTFFGELSDGQRWKLALDIAIDAVGEHGFLVIPQWAWGELQPANKKAIAERLRERGVLAYTAAATDGDCLTASVYE